MEYCFSFHGLLRSWKCVTPKQTRCGLPGLEVIAAPHDRRAGADHIVEDDHVLASR